jgi:hypothetical protein
MEGEGVVRVGREKGKRVSESRELSWKLVIGFLGFRVAVNLDLATQELYGIH